MKASISAALPLALLMLSSCGSSESTRIVDPPRAPVVYPNGYFKVSYVDSNGKLWLFPGAPLKKEGRVYQETVAPQLPASPPSESPWSLIFLKARLQKRKLSTFRNSSIPVDSQI